MKLNEGTPCFLVLHVMMYFPAQHFLPVSLLLLPFFHLPSDQIRTTVIVERMETGHATAMRPL